MMNDWLARREALTPEKVALVDAERGFRAITYREWNRAANRTANWLRTLGVSKGDLVGVLAANSVEYLDIWFACGKVGAILQTLNWRLATRELVGMLKDATPMVLIYGSEFAEQVREIKGSVPKIQKYVALDDFTTEREVCDNAPPPPVEVELDAPWVISYTGGTTGLPKGAIITHGNVLFNSVNTVMSWGLLPTDVTILNAPLFHTGGLNVLTAPLVHIGGTSIVCKGFDVDQVFDLIETQGVTVYFGVPTMFIAQQESLRWDGADFSRLRWVISGGAPCPPPVFEKWWARGMDFKTGYGMTECGPNTFWLPSEDVQRKPGSVGVPMFHVEVKVVGPDGAECDADEIGELLIRGPQVSPGYWNRPEETAETLRDGWLHTGDLARQDSEGYFYIVGRLKEMFISGGENVYPSEVEAAMSLHPGVVSVAVLGVPDARWGEVGVAAVVRRTGNGALTEEMLLEHTRTMLARYKVPKRIVFVDALPMTGAGKVDKLALKSVVSSQHFEL